MDVKRLKNAAWIWKTFFKDKESGCKSYPLEQLGVEKRSMAGAVLMVPPVVEIGDVSVVAKEGLLESSLSLCSWVREKLSFKHTGTINACLNVKLVKQQSHLQSFESSLLLFQSRLLLPLVHFSEGHPRAGQWWHCVWQSAGPAGKTHIHWRLIDFFLTYFTGYITFPLHLWSVNLTDWLDAEQSNKTFYLWAI